MEQCNVFRAVELPMSKYMEDDMVMIEYSATGKVVSDFDWEPWLEEVKGCIRDGWSARFSVSTSNPIAAVRLAVGACVYGDADVHNDVTICGDEWNTQTSEETRENLEAEQFINRINDLFVKAKDFGCKIVIENNTLYVEKVTRTKIEI